MISFALAFILLWQATPATDKAPKCALEGTCSTWAGGKYGKTIYHWELLYGITYEQCMARGGATYDSANPLPSDENVPSRCWIVEPAAAPVAKTICLTNGDCWTWGNGMFLDSPHPYCDITTLAGDCGYLFPEAVIDPKAAVKDGWICVHGNGEITCTKKGTK